MPDYIKMTREQLEKLLENAASRAVAKYKAEQSFTAPKFPSLNLDIPKFNNEEYLNRPKKHLTYFPKEGQWREMTPQEKENHREWVRQRDREDMDFERRCIMSPGSITRSEIWERREKRRWSHM